MTLYCSSSRFPSVTMCPIGLKADVVGLETEQTLSGMYKSYAKPHSWIIKLYQQFAHLRQVV